jgi:RNA polymerase sigma factor (sigma-70 family)
VTTSPSRDDWDAKDTRLRDAGDLEGLLARYVESIDGRCRAKIWNEHNAQDVAQRVLFRLWNELTAGKRYRAPFRVVVHQVISWTIKEHFGGPAEPDALDEWDARTDGGFSEIEERLTLERLFAELTERERRIFVLRYLDGVDITEIAASEGVTRNAIDQALHRGHEKLRGLADA